MLCLVAAVAWLALDSGARGGFQRFRFVAGLGNACLMPRPRGAACTAVHAVASYALCHRDALKLTGMRGKQLVLLRNAIVNPDQGCVYAALMQCCFKLHARSAALVQHEVKPSSLRHSCRLVHLLQK